MGQADELLATVEAIHGAALEAGRWDVALESVTRLSGATAASLETYDFDRGRHSFWRGYGSEPEMVAQYLDFHSGANPFAPRRSSPPPAPALRKFPQRQILDLSGRGREPFYADYVTYTSPGCFLAALLDSGRGPQTVFTLTRAIDTASTDPADARLFERVVPHVRLALEVADRLGGAHARSRSLARALDWIGDGAALLDAEGRVTHANAALEETARRADGLTLLATGLHLASAAARERLAEALGRARSLAAGEAARAPWSFAAARPSGAPPLVLTLRPLFPSEAEDAPSGAVAVLFVHDPLCGAGDDRDLLALAWGLTPSEADLASALRRGTAPAIHARERGVSINTVYTHLRRLKDKTGARRLPDLIHRLNEAAPAPLRRT